MEEALKWWKDQPSYRQKKLAEDYQWTTPEAITDYQIELIYNETQNY